LSDRASLARTLDAAGSGPCNIVLAVLLASGLSCLATTDAQADGAFFQLDLAPEAVDVET
jgi:hypothetical protein